MFDLSRIEADADIKIHYSIREGEMMNNHKGIHASLLQYANMQSFCINYAKLGFVLILLAATIESTREKECTICDHEDNSVNLSVGPFVLNHTHIVKSGNEAHKKYTHNPSGQCVEKRSNMSLQEFWDLYDGKWPVIITDIIPQWMAYRQWNREFFLHNYPDNKIALKSVQGDLKTGQFIDMKTFISFLEEPTCPTTWKYMEDEMFLIDKADLRHDIGSNYILDENFFTLFPREIQPWDCMMLWGTKHSRSTLHMDPYNWTALSAVIWGKKLWKLYPPGQDQYLYIQPDLKCGFPLECNKYDSSIDAFDTDYMKYPDFTKADYIEVEQKTGDLLVIPTGWYHQAYNDEETLSISTQLMNRNNFLVILEEIIKGRNLSRDKLPSDLSTLSAADQVKVFMSLLPEEILQKGRKITEQVLSHLNGVKDEL